MGQKIPNVGIAWHDTVEDAKVALKRARRAAKTSKAMLRALKGEVKLAKKHHKRAQKQVRVAERALDQAREAADRAIVKPAPKKSIGKRKPSEGKPVAREVAPAEANPPETPVAALALSRPFRPVKLKHGKPTHAAGPLVPIPSLPSITPAPTPETHAPMPGKNQ